MCLERFEKLSNIVLSIVTILAILCGGIFAIIEYLDYRKEIQIKNSLSIIERFNSGEVLGYKQKIDRVWDDVNPILKDLAKKDSSSEFYEGFILTVVKKNELIVPINSIFSLFEESVVCIESKVCDASIINEYLRENAKSFFRKFFPLVCSQRDKWNDPSIWYKFEHYYHPETINRICK